MATGANTHDFVVIHRSGLHRRPACREFFMAGVTRIGSWQVIATLSARRCSVMATNTIAYKTAVINSADLSPVVGVVAIIALQCCLQMPGVFTLRGGIIVATGTHANDFIVIDCVVGYRRPGCRSGLVTGIACIRAINMVRAFA
jgi:hypothetical protein